jgi:hypothetical protein
VAVPTKIATAIHPLTPGLRQLLERWRDAGPPGLRKTAAEALEADA